jgi:hypothetical protein
MLNNNLISFTLTTIAVKNKHAAIYESLIRDLAAALLSPAFDDADRSNGYCRTFSSRGIVKQPE